MPYDHKKIEPKWQKYWQQQKVFQVDEKPKDQFYMLDMFAYPSGEGLHVGHPRGYTASDILAKYYKMCGHNVLHPFGWDAFGLPAENYAIQIGAHPRETTANNIERFKSQLMSFGFGYDWEREIDTSKPEYYKWTQWLFKVLYDNGLAYQKEAYVNWCPKDKTVLANEQVVGGCCERCKTPVEQKKMNQWFFKITDFAEELIDGLDKLDWPDSTKEMQKNWIGRSEGAELNFVVDGEKPRIILMHGKDTDPSWKWYPWFIKNIEMQGFQVDAPVLPHADNPKLAEWLSVLDKLKPDENTILVGHSRGGGAIMRWLEHQPEKARVAKVVLVASNRGDAKKESDFFDDGDYDYKKIKKHCDNFIVIHSRDDEWVPFESGEHIAKNLSAKFVTFDDKGHFGKKTSEVPEILSEVISAIRVFTTRPDTLFGATYMVLAPEHELVEKITTKEQKKEVKKYVKDAQLKSRLDRTAVKEKTGVFTGAYAINPGTEEKIPIWIADYVLADYGFGAVMAVPAHDERDFEFAKKYKLPITQVIAPLYTTDEGDDAVREDKETGRRKMVTVIIKHWKEDKVFCLNWEKFNWKSFILGGVEEGETLEKAAVREAKEESGYQNIKSVAKLGFETHSNFFARHKDINRYSMSECFVIELADGECSELEEEHTKHHKGSWISRKKVSEYVNLSNNIYYADIFLNGEKAFVGHGITINSDKFDNLASEEAGAKITKKVGGKITVQYKLHDWLVSRQRYWGAPIPIIYRPCHPEFISGSKDEMLKQVQHDGWEAVSVDAKDLPVILPEDVDFKPSGESPLVGSKEFHKDVKREVDTLDTFVCSSWYFLRYCDPKNAKEFAGRASLKYWMPVNYYIGGAEHTNGHLLYARFIVKALHKLGYLDFDEPFLKLRHQGLILGPDGDKMSKSKGNVVNPDDLIEQYGADTMRMYAMFIGPFALSVPWSIQGVVGVRRFLDKVWKAVEDSTKNKAKTDDGKLHCLTKKVTEDLENEKFNTAVSSMMEFVNNVEGGGWAETFAKLLAPFAPHMAEELWQKVLKNKGSVLNTSWPKFDAKKAKADTVTIVVTENGKKRGTLELPVGVGEKIVLEAVKKDERLNEIAKKAKKHIYIQDRMINFI